MDPSLQSERENKPMEEAEMQRRELTLEDEQHIWKDITLTQYIYTHTHARCREMRRLVQKERILTLRITVRCFSLKKILGVSSLDDVLDQYHVNPRNIIHNMTKVNKHGVVTLEDKTGRSGQGKRLGSSHPDDLQFTAQHTGAVAQVGLLILSPDDLPHWVLNAMKSLANCEYQGVVILIDIS